MRVASLALILPLAVCCGFFAWSSVADARSLAENSPIQGGAEAKAKVTEQKQKPTPSSDRFKSEWKEVRAKYPEVAAAYLESLEFIVDSRALPYQASAVRQIDGLAERLRALGVTLRRCRWVCDPLPEAEPEPPSICPLCPLARDSDDLERYLECLEKRIDCLAP